MEWNGTDLGLVDDSARDIKVKKPGDDKGKDHTGQQEIEETVALPKSPVLRHCCSTCTSIVAVIAGLVPLFNVLRLNVHRTSNILCT